MEGFKIINDYSPVANLVVYQCTENNNTYCEIHQIDRRGKMLQGKPVSKNLIRELLKETNTELKENLTFHCLIPENVMWYDSQMGIHKIVWYTKPMRRQIHFESSMKMPGGLANIPGMIWMYDGSSLKVFAYKGSCPKVKRIKGIMDIEIFNVPFFNVYDDGSICWGNVKRKDKFYLFEEIMEYWENLFFNSKFSSHLHTESNLDLHAYWRSAIENNLKFDYSILKKNKTNFDIKFRELRREN